MERLRRRHYNNNNRKIVVSSFVNTYLRVFLPMFVPVSYYTLFSIEVRLYTVGPNELCS
jgi:hypothetical protein